jgi:hypothetical protein
LFLTIHHFELHPPPPNNNPTFRSGLGGGALFVLARRATAAYESAVRAGSWTEGLITFPSGDIVVRSTASGRAVDATIEAM